MRPLQRLGHAPTTFPLLLSLLSGALPATRAGDLPGNYSTWMATSIMSRSQGVLGGPGDASQLLQAGFTQKAFHQLLSTSARNDALSDSLAAYVQRSVDSVTSVLANASHDTAYPLDRLSSGDALLRAYADTGNASYGAALAALQTSVGLQPRNAAGGLWYYVYPNWSYLDGMYSYAPFSAAYATQHGGALRPAAANITHQLDLLWAHCYDAATGLLVHGYDDAKTAVWADPVTGASPHVWGRSLGWYAMALVDTLETLQGPLVGAGVDAGAWRHLHDRFGTLAGAIARAADPATGGWWQVLDAPGREGNYVESSGSAMLAYALLKGVRLGFLGGGFSTGGAGNTSGSESVGNASYVDVASRAYQYVAETFVVNDGNGTLGYNGTVSVCSLNSTASYDYYVGQPILYNSVLGSAAFVLASLEYERLAAASS
ncbi:putative cell wall glycosyl hydrolase YteR [Fomitopsis serialis]|uniref:putative cell wall glycosyl hydrolase YteR n=1 Tax=Fomitopsis serialis TaxID=139415 RepID=UPI0020072356|nr:putative cell wall glycosyl hydrolase YteR [Neoantrodia serialis]KAH9917010.1 putative cell wall glycosyl hydrolase YteR [Neoantrodia serialis]